MVDSTNLYIVEKLIAENKGWISKDSISVLASQAQFLTIQHADLKTQLKYIDMFRKAVKDRKASSGNLAYLEDRILIRQHKKQRYGTQSVTNKDGINTLAPIRNKWNVNKRRKRVGLSPL